MRARAARLNVGVASGLAAPSGVGVGVGSTFGVSSAAAGSAGVATRPGDPEAESPGRRCVRSSSRTFERSWSEISVPSGAD